MKEFDQNVFLRKHKGEVFKAYLLIA